MTTTTNINTNATNTAAITLSEKAQAFLDKLNHTTFDLCGDVFIVPNSSGPISSFWVDSFKNEYRELAHLNGITGADEEIRLTQVWIVSDAKSCDNVTNKKRLLNTDNLGDHRGIVDVDLDGIRFAVGVSGNNCGYIPSKLMSGVKEGESFTYKVNLTVNYIDPCNSAASEVAGELNTAMKGMTVSTNMTLRANQGAYRYRQFGDFETVFNKVNF